MREVAQTAAEPRDYGLFGIEWEGRSDVVIV
jgi:hypothetical protein